MCRSFEAAIAPKTHDVRSLPVERDDPRGEGSTALSPWSASRTR